MRGIRLDVFYLRSSISIKSTNILRTFKPILKPKSSVIVALRKIKEQPTCVIFNNACFYKDKEYYNEHTLRRIKKMFLNAKFVLYFVDSAFQPWLKKL